MDVYINQKRVRLRPKQAIGKGGEADVYRLNRTTAVKLFKSPSHPDFVGMAEAQQGARERLALHQQKLRQFPQSLPERVIAPQGLVMNQGGRRILGYTMPLVANAEVLLRYCDLRRRVGDHRRRVGDHRQVRQTIDTQVVVNLFLDLHETVAKLHCADVVIGDFNDLNILVQGTQAFLIDADSFQFGSFPCSVFTARFVDPLLCDPQGTQPILCRPYSWESDWYAFTVMLMQALLFVNPYGGVYRPSDPAQRLPAAARPLHRITVFHPQVRYPKPALPCDRLPEALLDHFQRVFEQDWRGAFPRSLLENLRWQTCPSCGVEHARSACPSCVQSIGVAPPVQQGQVKVTTVLQTDGVILAATLTAGHLQWLVWEEGQFKREDGAVMLTGDLSPESDWYLQGQTTWIAQQGQVVRLSADTERISVDCYQGRPQVAVNDRHCYWLSQGQLMRDHSVVGEVLAGQTQFWVGPRFGLGFYRAGRLNGAFVFDVQRSGINDRLSLSMGAGTIVAANCTFSQSLGWLFVTIQDQGVLQQQCWVIAPTGQVVAQADVGEWTAGRSPICPHWAVEDALLVATDEGIARVQVDQGRLILQRQFPETEPFVQTGYQVLAAPQGLYTVGSQTIQLLQL
ncbi:hypothetical protein [Acaryochloris marina]|uniref:hypothetical protein n=1 Tax=Acaryochloris marina TaxID=155978 RepID=UPI001BAED82E|nr:hypothetical protein [Acaryochloris marina]QUY40439.1 hypothetical protein I1H34_13735 [Acaryochloris marina S15]QUY45004.1 hypothetical protein I1H34_13590 [Acaryochloris marina S15]